MAMSSLTNIANGSNVDATPVDGNFDIIDDHIRTELVHRDGTIAMTGELTLSSSSPSGNLVAASKGYVDAQTSSALPPGCILDYIDATPPSGWLLCDGSAVSRTTYANLFAVVGTTFGPGDGGSTFNLPDLRQKVSVGIDSFDTAFDAVGETGGTADAFVVSHAHDIAHGHGHSLSVSNSSDLDHTHSAGTLATGTTGSDHNHNFPAQNYLYFNAGASSTATSGGTAPISNVAAGGTGGDTHTHNVTGSTGNPSANFIHSHGLTGGVTALPTTDSETVGSSTVTNMNYPPFIVLAKIIKT